MFHQVLEVFGHFFFKCLFLALCGSLPAAVPRGSDRLSQAPLRSPDGRLPVGLFSSGRRSATSSLLAMPFSSCLIPVTATFGSRVPLASFSVSFLCQEELSVRLLVRLYWVGQKVHIIFSHKMNDTFFIFTNNFIDLDILSVSAISCTV